MGRDPHAEAVRLVSNDFHQVEFQKLVELDLVAAQFLLSTHRLTRLFVGPDGDIAAAGPAIGRALGNAALAADRPAGHENARPADLAELGSPLLRQIPGPILEGVDGKDAGNAEMQVEFAVKIFQMAMAIHEARHHGPPGDIDHLGVGRDRHVPRIADCLEPAALDQDDRIFDGLPAGTVDQLAALDRQNLKNHSPFPNHSSERPIVAPCR